MLADRSVLENVEVLAFVRMPSEKRGPTLLATRTPRFDESEFESIFRPSLNLNHRRFTFTLPEALIFHASVTRVPDAEKRYDDDLLDCSPLKPPLPLRR